MDTCFLETFKGLCIAEKCIVMVYLDHILTQAHNYFSLRWNLSVYDMLIYNDVTENTNRA